MKVSIYVLFVMFTDMFRGLASGLCLIVLMLLCCQVDDLSSLSLMQTLSLSEGGCLHTHPVTAARATKPTQSLNTLS